jgi:biotin carboxyl carrier protein
MASLFAKWNMKVNARHRAKVPKTQGRETSRFFNRFVLPKNDVMLHATVNNKTFDIEWNKDLKGGELNGKSFAIDRIAIDEKRSHVIFNNKSFTIEIAQIDKDEKKVVVIVNGKKHAVQLKDRFDDLLKSLGMEGTSSAKFKDIKAPMPGMVLNVLVKAGDQIEKDTPLVILEAMKMENVIKSPVAGTIKKVGATQGTAVEKNALLVEFV